MNPYKEMGGRSALRIKAEKANEDINKHFNGKNELNAWDKKDAGQQILDVLDKTRKGGIELFADRFVTDDVKTKILAEVAKDPVNGFPVIGQVLQEPIYNIVEYAGWIRKCLRGKTVAQGTEFKIGKDVDVAGWIVAGDGQTIVSQTKTRYIYPGRFKNTAFVEVDIEDIVAGNFDIFDRSVVKAAWEIMRQEDVRGVALLTAAAVTENELTSFGTLNLDVFEDIRFQVERWRLTVDKFIINRSDLRDVIKTMSTQVDFITQRELIVAGYIGNVLNSQVITSAGIGQQEVLPPGTVFAMTEGKYLGEIGEMLPVQSEPYSTLVRGEVKKGHAYYEIIGEGVANHRAIAMGQK